MSENLKVAHDIQTKFRFYFVALVFTLLAATIQTSNLKDIPSVLIIIELLSWFLLILSGLTSLSFLEDTPVIFKQQHAIEEYETHPELVEKLQVSLKKKDTAMSIKYRIAKYSFMFGLILVALSRASQGICNA